MRLAGSTGNASQTDRKNDGSQKEDKSHGQGNGWAYGSENLDNNKNKVRKDNGNHSDSDVEGGGNSGEFTWDDENRLVVAKNTGNGQSTYFLYDYQGDRTIKRGQGGETLYVNEYYQLQNQDIITKHIFVGNTRIVSKLTHYDTYDSVYEKQNIYTYHPDHLGSSNFVTDYAGNEFEHMEYTPYGESWVDEGTNKNVIGYRFTSKELDGETGLYYFGARYLDPLTSRWMSPDPAFEKYLPEPPVDDEARKRNGQLPGQDGVFNPVNLNVYSYAGNNPLLYTDPDGSAITWTQVGKFGLASAEIIGGGLGVVGGSVIAVGTSETVGGAILGGAIVIHSANTFASGVADMVDLFKNNGKDFGNFNFLLNSVYRPFFTTILGNERAGDVVGNIVYTGVDIGLSVKGTWQALRYASGLSKTMIKSFGYTGDWVAGFIRNCSRTVVTAPKGLERAVKGSIVIRDAMIYYLDAKGTWYVLKPTENQK